MFIAVEGIDGSGKSTTLKEIAKYLESRGHKVYLTAEPTGLPTGKLIREFLKNHTAEKHTHETLALLFAADRLQHIVTEIEPKLKEGYTVITDRYLFSSIAYQSVYLPFDWVEQINRFAVLPDMVIYIDVSIETALSRITRFREDTELFETRSFLSSVRDNYTKIFREYGKKLPVILLDGEVDMKDIGRDVSEKLCDFFQLHFFVEFFVLLGIKCQSGVAGHETL